MNVILDTDIASCLSKINGFEIVFKLFPSSKFYIPARVFEELKEAEELGFRFIETVFNLLGRKIEITSLDEEEMWDYEEINRIGKFGYGEKACIAICRNRADFILLSNDEHVNKKSRELGIKVYNLEDLLSLAIETGVIRGEEDLEALMNKIENLDRVRIRDKDYLRGKVKKNETK
jgi:predicted nucleic acid-binding protein